MSALKLPVTAFQLKHPDNGSHAWAVMDLNNSVFCRDLNDQEAKQIALALNLHDELVSALKFYARTPKEIRNRANPDCDGTFNDWCAEIGPDGGDIARSALKGLIP